MLSSPKKGERVQVRYGRDYCHLMQFHEAIGFVKVVSRGRPRNHGVEIIGGPLLVVPAGNLFRLPGRKYTRRKS